MFVLRVIQEQKEDGWKVPKSQVTNHCLGGSYEVLRRAGKETFGKVIGEKDVEIVLFKNTKKLHFDYFIMTGNGSTFEKIVNRG